MNKPFKLSGKAKHSVQEIFKLLKLKLPVEKKIDYDNIDDLSWVILTKKIRNRLDSPLYKVFDYEGIGEIDILFKYAKELPGSEQDQTAFLTSSMERNSAEIMSVLEVLYKGRRIAVFGVRGINIEKMWLSYDKKGYLVPADTKGAKRVRAQSDSKDARMAAEKEKATGEAFSSSFSSKTIETYLHVYKADGTVIEDTSIGGDIVDSISAFCSLDKKDIEYIFSISATEEVA